MLWVLALILRIQFEEGGISFGGEEEGFMELLRHPKTLARTRWELSEVPSSWFRPIFMPCLVFFSPTPG